MQNLDISPNFRKMVFKSIYAIVLFILLYVILLALAVGLTVLCCYAGFYIMVFKISFITLMIGLGLISVGFLVLYFLIKFIFKRHKTDLSQLIEIYRTDEPRLFDLIDELAMEAKTSKPKKVFLSADVNACVFYDSSFWSMFLPVKKNLQIGLGLVNSLTTQELKAVLAHEFGHFSQKSMKVGSYVYSVNKVIYNMLYDNSSYSSMLEKFAGLSGYFAFFVNIAVSVVNQIQNILRNAYNWVNISYMALSREMEYHADAVAASIAGSKAVGDSLRRLELADSAYNSVLNHYHSKNKQALVTANIYPQHTFVMKYFADKSAIPFENTLPLIDAAFNLKNRFTRLNMNSQWASHPETEDRVNKVIGINPEPNAVDNSLAINLFVNPQKWQQQLSNRFFEAYQFEKEKQFIELEQFETAFKEEYDKSGFPEEFNSYYNRYNPLIKDVNTLKAIQVSTEGYSVKQLFSDEMLERINRYNAMEADFAGLEAILGEDSTINTFDYSGERYKKKDAPILKASLLKEKEALKAELEKHDVLVFWYFFSLAINKHKQAEFEQAYQQFVDFDKRFDVCSKHFQDVQQALAFTQYQNEFSVIKNSFTKFYPIEITFKQMLKEQLSIQIEDPIIDDDVLQKLNNYVNSELIYFENDTYQSEKLDLLFEAMNNFSGILGNNYFKIKKKLLQLMAAIHAQN